MKQVKKKLLLIFAILGILIPGCIDPYEPPVSNAETNFLVIDGNINSTGNVAIVKLSRAIALASTAPFPPETGATVFIEDENNQLTALPEVADGIYSVNKIFDTELQYRLKVSSGTSNYQSDFILLETNAPIDSVTWRADDTHLEILANTHDFSDGPKYFRYSVEETYEYTSVFYSSYKLENGIAVYRSPTESVYNCWITQNPISLLLGTTENLSQNIIANFLVQKIEKGDRRLWRKYSVLVRQMALDRKTYEYWTQLKNITESLGGLFDPIPYQVNGNIFSETDSKEVVLGYFSGGNVNEKRIVIANNQLPNGYLTILQSECEEDYVTLGDLPLLVGRNVLLTRPELEGITVVGYYFAIPACADCRTQGGTNVKPDFMN